MLHFVLPSIQFFYEPDGKELGFVAKLRPCQGGWVPGRLPEFQNVDSCRRFVKGSCRCRKLIDIHL